jgi:pyruvate dehydrogenase E2 component (dihydrolipoamide acetyltransferase)
MSTSLLMPNLGAASDEAVLVGWLVSEGDQVTIGQPLFEIETDKSLVTVEATEDGEVGRLFVKAGDTVPVGSPIAEFRSRDAVDAPADLGAGAAQAPAGPAPAPALERPGGRTANLSPRARRLASRLGIDPSVIQGTGPNGTVTEADVAAAGARTGSALDTESAPSQVRSHGGVTATLDSGSAPAADPLAGLTGPRAVIARRMWASSQETAAVTLAGEAEVDALMDAMSARRVQYPDSAAGLTLDLFVARCVALALQVHPELNASLTPLGLVSRDGIDVGIALDAANGLIVAVLKETATRPLAELAKTWADLKERALAGRASPAELTGGTFTVTNLGHLGVGFFTPIINPGEAAILGLGRVAARAVVHDGQVVAARTLPLSLTFDHRVVDGAAAARFLRRVSELLEHPLDIR